MPHPGNASTQTSTPYPAQRLAVPLGRPYRAAIRHFEQLVPVVDAARFGHLDSWQEVVELADSAAPLGFLRYWSGDIPTFMAGSGNQWECTAYLMGNHVIAERMYRHNPAVIELTHPTTDIAGTT